MSVDEIHATTKEWAAAAKRAVEVAGFDGVEIHGKHRNDIYESGVVEHLS